jgi:hypothetical protein
MNRGNVQKTPLAPSFNRIALQTVAGAIQKLGKALPCTVVSVSASMVTVKFEVIEAQALPQITIPKMEGAWIRSPTQVGDQGLTVPSDVYLGGVSGLGGGTATLTPMPNLTALGWLPVANTAFPAVNTNAAYVAGPQGAVIQTSDGTSKIVVSESGIVISFAGKVWTFNAAGLTISSGVVAETHVHLYSPGGGTPTDTGVPIA